ncbi:MAG: sulfurtransferase, partial [Lewinella sp.]|nr:sulfurtransferase [Lewinella sp.]
MFSTLISADVLKAQLGPQLVIIDCRFDLADTEAGRRAYLAGHIPGAIYAHLDDDLSGPCEATKTGRHPLPCVTAAATLFSRWGITDGRQVVVYDDKRGAIAARLWWMLRWLGHEAVAVLDGGWAAWEAAGGPVSEEATKPIPANFTARPHEGWTVSAEEVDQWRANDAFAVVDSRAAERYRGEIEPIDPVAGHIPGARNLP